MNLSIDVGAIAVNFVAMMICFLEICCCVNIVRLRKFVLQGNKVEEDTPPFYYWLHSKSLEVCLGPSLIFVYRYMDPILLYIMLGVSLVGFLFEIWFVRYKCRGLEITPEIFEDDDENF